MRGKNKCRILKEIRQKIADENEIPYVTRECSYQGECSGTCPKCEAELRYLEQQLERRQKLGKTVTVAALAAAMMASAAACTPASEREGTEVSEKPTETLEVLMGESVETFEFQTLLTDEEKTTMGMIPVDTSEPDVLYGEALPATDDCEPSCSDGE